MLSSVRGSALAFPPTSPNKKPAPTGAGFLLNLFCSFHSEREGQAPPLRYDEIIPLHYSLLLIAYRQKSSLSFWTGCDFWRSGWDLLLRSINFESTRSGVTIHTKSPPGWVGFLYGGVGGIRTHGTVAGTPDFEPFGEEIQ